MTEHWATRLKRENRELKTKNTELKTKNTELKAKLDAELKTKLAAKSPSVVDHPAHLFVAVINADSNWLCEGQTFRLASSDEVLRREPLDEDQVDIVVEDHLDKEEGANFSGGDELQGNWASVSFNFQIFHKQYIEGKNIRTVYDPHGFTYPFNLSADQVIRERLKLAEPEPEKRAEYDYQGYWHVAFIKLNELYVNGESFYDQYKRATTSKEKSELMNDTRSLIDINYENGRHHPKHERIRHFSLDGSKEEPISEISFSVIADKGQIVRVSYGHTTPYSKQRRVGYYMEKIPNGTTSNADPEGGKVRFV